MHSANLRGKNGIAFAVGLSLKPNKLHGNVRIVRMSMVVLEQSGSEKVENRSNEHGGKPAEKWRRIYHT